MSILTRGREEGMSSRQASLCMRMCGVCQCECVCASLSLCFVSLRYSRCYEQECLSTLDTIGSNPIVSFGGAAHPCRSFACFGTHWRVSVVDLPSLW